MRLKRDGLTDQQKEQVDGILSKVGRTGRQGEYHLSSAFINLVESNWPGYSPSDKSIVASLKVSVLFQPILTEVLMFRYFSALPYTYPRLLYTAKSVC